MTTPTRDHLLSNKVYDYGKKLAQVVLPALITLYAALGATWGWVKVEEVVATLGAINVFIGVVLGVSAKSYSGSRGEFDEALTKVVSKPELVRVVDIDNDDDTYYGEH